jgi:hypothetical protein
VDAPTAHALDDFLVIHVDLDDTVDRDALVLQGIGLRQGARETVEQEAVGAVIFLDALLDEAKDDIVGNQAIWGMLYFSLM